MVPQGILDAIQLVESGAADAGLAFLPCPNPDKASKLSLRIVRGDHDQWRV